MLKQVRIIPAGDDYIAVDENTNEPYLEPQPTIAIMMAILTMFGFYRGQQGLTFYRH